MSDRSVHFDFISVQRMGNRVRTGDGFQLVDLSPSINLIFGPTGSGKTTTALAIQELLWPCRTDISAASLRGRFHDGEDNWYVSLDSGHVECTCNGAVGSSPTLGPPERRHCYRLLLSDLIQKDDAEFASAIARASQGGYDLAAASDVLGYRAKPKSPRAQHQEFQCRRAELEKAQHHQREIEVAADQLEGLLDLNQANSGRYFSSAHKKLENSRRFGAFNG
jgi:hypothetical protein